MRAFVSFFSLVFGGGRFTISVFSPGSLYIRPKTRGACPVTTYNIPGTLFWQGVIVRSTTTTATPKRPEIFCFAHIFPRKLAAAEPSVPKVEP